MPRAYCCHNFFFSSRRRHTRCGRDWSQTCALPIFYRRTKDIVQFAKELQTETEEGAEFDLGAMSLDAEADDATVAKLLQSIFTDAVQVRASDIHIEPDEGALRIRMRVDGVLQENVLTEANIANALLLRLKLMAGLDISEKRLPQDGRFNIKVRGHSIDVRVSTMPDRKSTRLNSSHVR